MCGTKQSRNCQHQSFQLQSHRFFANPCKVIVSFCTMALARPIFLYYISLAVRRYLLRPRLPLHSPLFSILFSSTRLLRLSPLLQLSPRVANVSSKNWQKLARNSPRRRLSSTISALHCHKVKPLILITSLSKRTLGFLQVDPNPLSHPSSSSLSHLLVIPQLVLKNACLHTDSARHTFFTLFALVLSSVLSSASGSSVSIDSAAAESKRESGGVCLHVPAAVL
mmetsp:Transcript_23863/g.40012  ORF Transcript_23863/g.40012 Transcript_23863/m.40012 type:complete len:224 (-) Transcript_23863:949-1620(-)